MTLQQCKRLAAEHGLSSHPAASFVNGALAGAAGTIASYPFDLLRTTLAAQGEPKVYSGMLEAARCIIKENGVGGLYRGMGITVLEIMPYAALQFGLYDVFNSMADGLRLGKAYDPDATPSRPPPLQSFVCGLAAGTLAKLGTHPLDVVKKRFQVAGLQRSARYGERVSARAAASFFLCCRNIAQREGINGFYKGALPSILKAAPSAAVTFACYDLFLRLLTPPCEATAATVATPRLH
jgi:solute carrier family 25 thiamine pyrophosphate transporter 19